MDLQAQAKALWDAKRQELEAMYPSLRVMPRPVFPALPTAAQRSLPEPYRLVLGRDEHGPFSFDSKLLCAHIDLVGGIGSGKSNAMRQMAWSNIASAPALTSGSRGTSDERSTNSGSSLSYDRPGPLGVRGLPASGTESSGSSRGSGSSS